MTSPVFTARVPFTAPQIGATYDPQQMRTALNGIARAIPPTRTRSTTVDTIIAATDDTLLVDTTDDDLTVTLLPANQVQFLRVQIKNTGANTVTISGTVDGVASPLLFSNAGVVIQSDGVAWRLLAGSFTADINIEVIVDDFKYPFDPDDTAAFNRAVAATANGGRITTRDRAYVISGDVWLKHSYTRLTVTPGATITSSQGRLRIASVSGLLTDVTLDLTTSQHYFTNGAAAASLDRYVRVEGHYNGSLLPITAIAANDRYFTCVTATNASGLVNGDWVLVGEQGGPVGAPDWQRCEWKQVLSVSGAQVNVTTPFRRAINTYTLGFYRTFPATNITVLGGTIHTLGTTVDNYGVDAEICRNFRMENVAFDIAKGLAWQTYMHDTPVILGCKILRQVGRRSSISCCLDGYIGYNHLFSLGAIPTSGMFSFETATSWCTVIGNSGIGIDPSGVFSVIWCDFNDFISNSIGSDGTKIGILLIGGEGNTTTKNRLNNVLEGVRFDSDTVTVPARPAVGNTSDGDVVRNATTGVRIRAGTGNAISLLNTDSTVTTNYVDAGTASVITIPPFVPATLPAIIELTGAPSSVTELHLGSSGNKGTVGSAFSSGNVLMCSNATAANVGGVDTWTQSSGVAASLLILLDPINGFEVFVAPLGTAPALPTFANFWGNAVFRVATNGFVSVAGSQVLANRSTGWTTMTGTATKLMAAFDTSTITTAQLAQCYKALVDLLLVTGQIAA